MRTIQARLFQYVSVRTVILLVVVGIATVVSACGGAGSTSPVESYKGTMGTLGDDYAKTFRAIADLSRSPQFADAAWRDRYVKAVGELKPLGERARQVQPPQCVEAAHASFLEAVNRYDRSADLLLAGVDSLNAGLVAQSNQLTNEGTTFLNRSADMIGQAKC